MRHREGVFAIGLVEEAIKFLELVFEEGQVQGLELLEDLVGEDEVKAIDFGSAAADEDGDEGRELLHDTVAEREAEMTDDEVVELVELIEHGLRDGILLDRVVE